MIKLRDLSLLQDFLDHEISWRIKEISNIKLAIRTSSPPLQDTLVRAGLPLLYAHWEGFVKKSSEGYIRFVNDQRLNYDELASCFVVFGAKKHLAALLSARKANTSIAAVDFFISHLSERAVLRIEKAIDTESNLSSKVFENIVLSIGIDSKRYQTRYNLMDSSLLKRRNMIAHGEWLDLQTEGYRELADEVIDLMRDLKTDIENAASRGLFRRDTVNV